MAGLEELRDRVAVDGHADRDAPGWLVVPDLELKRVEQLTLKILGEAGEVGLDGRESVQERRDPPQDFSNMSITYYHSAMACLTRRVRIGVALLRGQLAVGAGQRFGVDPLVGGEERHARLVQLWPNGFARSLGLCLWNGQPYGSGFGLLEDGSAYGGIPESVRAGPGGTRPGQWGWRG